MCIMHIMSGTCVHAAIGAVCPGRIQPIGLRLTLSFSIFCSSSDTIKLFLLLCAQVPKQQVLVISDDLDQVRLQQQGFPWITSLHPLGQLS